LSLPQLWTSVNRTSLVRYGRSADRLSCLQPMCTPRQAAALLLSVMVLVGRAPAQTPSPSQFQDPKVRPDPKRAQKAAEHGEKAEAAGHFEEALMAYEEALHYTPQDASIIERAAMLRSKLVRTHVEAAERDALAGQLMLATDELAAAIEIDPGNAIVAERLAQIKNMEDEPPPKPANGISGMPRLQPQSGKRNVDLRGDTKTTYEQLAAMFGI